MPRQGVEGHVLPPQRPVRVVHVEAKQGKRVAGHLCARACVWGAGGGGGGGGVELGVRMGDAPPRARRVKSNRTCVYVIGLVKSHTDAAIRSMSLMMPASVRVRPDVCATRITTAMFSVKAVRVLPATSRPTFCSATCASGSCVSATGSRNKKDQGAKRLMDTSGLEPFGSRSCSSRCVTTSRAASAAMDKNCSTKPVRSNSISP